MTGTSSSSAHSDKSGKNKSLLVATVKDEFASSPARNSMFGQEGNMAIEHEILKENHEALKRDYERVQEKIKHEEETYETMKNLQSKTEDLQVTNTRLLEDCERERSEKEKYKKMFEEMKAMESERKATIDELMMKKQELLMARRRQKEDLETMENKFVELADKFGVIETEYSYLKSLYDAEVAASGETENLIGHGGNDVNNNVTDSEMISDESDDEQDDPPRESNITTQRSVDKSQEEQCKNRASSSNGNQALGETVTPRAVNHPLPFPASPSSSSSSSSDGYDVVVKLPANWPEWAIPKGPGDDSNKS